MSAYQGLTFFVALVLVPSVAMADAPPSLPATHEISSANQAIQVISSPDEGTHILERVSQQELWSMPGWFRSLFVSNDGDYLVLGYDGISLIPQDYTDDLVLLTFLHRGKVLRKVTLKDIVPDPSILLRTVSHYQWGWIEGINSNGEFVVHRVDGTVFSFDLSTGLSK